MLDLQKQSVGKKNFSRGIKVDCDDKTAKIDVSIIVEYGARIPDVAFEIQTMIKKSVESMTGLKVKDDKEEKNEEEIEKTEEQN